MFSKARKEMMEDITRKVKWLERCTEGDTLAVEQPRHKYDGKISYSDDIRIFPTTPNFVRSNVGIVDFSAERGTTAGLEHFMIRYRNHDCELVPVVMTFTEDGAREKLCELTNMTMLYLSEIGGVPLRDPYEAKRIVYSPTFRFRERR